MNSVSACVGLRLPQIGLAALLAIGVPTAANALVIDVDIGLGGVTIDLSVILGSQELTVIHMGDLHGHMIRRPSVRTGAPVNHHVGGLARMYTTIHDVRNAHSNVLLFNTGDTIQGSAEALYTRGQAQVDILNGWGIDAFAPGNWDYVYGWGIDA